MKKWLIVPIIVVAACCAIISCGGDDNPVGEAPPTSSSTQNGPTGEEKPYLRVSNSLLTLDSQNPEEKIYVYTRENWTVSDVPEWISVSPAKGEGESYITIKALEPGAEESRSGNFLITAGELTVTILVEQIGTMSLVVTDEVILSNGFCSFLDLGDKVVSYTGVAHPTSDYQYMPEAYINTQLKNGSRVTKGSSNALMWSGRKADTEYTVCMAGFDANGNMGPLVVRTVKTPPETFVWDAPISNLTATSNQWSFSVSMDGNCRHYYLIYWMDATAVSANSSASDIALASVIKDNLSQLTRQSSSANKAIKKSSTNYALLIISWGLNQNNEFSARISRAYKNTSTLSTSNQQTVIPFSPDMENPQCESMPDDLLRNVSVTEEIGN